MNTYNNCITDPEGPHQRIQRPTLRPSISYDELPTSVVGYLGRNYHCIITPPRGSKKKNNDNGNNESSSESAQLIPEIIQRNRRRPIFIYLVSLIDIVILVYSCAAGGIETIGLKSVTEYKEVSLFGYIHMNGSGTPKEKFGIIPGVNIFIGPNASFLVRTGALFSPVSYYVTFSSSSPCIASKNTLNVIEP